MAGFVEGLRFDALPTDVVETVKWAILDCLGASAFGATTEWAGLARRYVQKYGGRGKSEIIGVRWTTASRDAALLNGLSAHGFELDDTHVLSTSHPGAVIIPAAMAALTESQVDGRGFLTGVVAGYEVMTRIGMAVGPSHISRGFHPTATTGPFGAGVAVAKMLSLGRAEVVSTLGIAGSLSSGLMEFAHDPWGDMVKRLQAGKAAEGGLTAALLAASGYRAPRSTLEGVHGFVRTFADEPAMRKLTDSLGKVYQLSHVSFKPYACCSNLHAVIDGVKALMEGGGVTADTVREVIVGGNRDLVQHHGKRANLSTVFAAQYSAPYAVAATLAGVIDDPAAAFSMAAVRSQRMASLCRRTTVRLDREMDALFPRHEAARVHLRLKNGKRYRQTVIHPKGSPGSPLSRAELEAKFATLASQSFEAAGVQAIKDMVLDLEHVGDVRSVAALLTGVLP